MKKQLFTAAASIGLLFTTFSAQASAQDYKVQSGDTLWKIAYANNVSIQDLKTWNNLQSDMIIVGQNLVVTVPKSNVYYDSYKVQSGDSLWKIASKHGITVHQLKSMNGITSDEIYVGQVLKLNSSIAATFNTEALITEGKKYIGVPYVWGGSTPNGFDCSGFLNYVFGKVGVSIPRTVETIWNATTPVSTPQKGDLVFFTTYKEGPSHAGIYLGNNQFLHAGTSKGVTITDMNNSYWKARYLGAKKVNY